MTLQLLHVGSRALHQQAPQILVAALADAEQVVSTACAVFGQTQDTITGFTYDNMGNVKTITRPLGRSTAYTYDILSRVSQQDVTTDAAKLTIKKSYDGTDQVISITDPLNLSTTYAIDGLGNQTQRNSPDTQTTTYTVDESGNVLTSIDARGKLTSFQYDAIGRLVQEQYQSGTASQFEYDGGPSGPTSEIGNLTRITDESGSTVFTHDLKGRVLTKSQLVDAGGVSVSFTVQYRYGTSGGATGKLESIRYPSGSVVNYYYDLNGRVASVKLSQADPSGGGMLKEVPLLSNILYSPTGTIKSWSWGNSALPTYQRTYDLDGRLISYPVDLFGMIRTVSYNPANLVTAYSHTGSSNPDQYNQSFGYDTADRLTSFTTGGLTTTYIYDANGNRVQQTGPSVTYAFETKGNRLSSASFQVPRSYSYDAAGNRIADGLNYFSYSDRGRLSQVRGSASLDMFYNGFGQRVLKSGTADRIYYVYDEAGRTLGEYRLSNLPVAETVYLGDLPIAVITPQSYFYILTDHLKAPVVVAKNVGDIVWDWRNHDPFGNNAPISSADLPLYDHRFPGQIADVETGLFYNYFRDYDPQTGRYVQSDPIGLAGGLNTYIYVLGDPLRRIDLFGLADSFSTVQCDGKGNLVVVNRNTSVSANCTQIHEESHLKDLIKRYGPDVCKGKPKGYYPHASVNGDDYRDFLRDTECRAYTAAMSCVKKCNDNGDALRKYRNMMQEYSCNKYDSWKNY